MTHLHPSLVMYLALNCISGKSSHGQFSRQKLPPKMFTLEILRECRYAEKMKTMRKDFLTKVIKMLKFPFSERVNST